MRLSTFSVKNFRSITNAHEINFSNVSTLVGKNNEGKSNILKALNISMNILKNHGQKNIDKSFPSRKKNKEEIYFWERDFPIQIQNKIKRNKNTIFKLEFELSEDEATEFYNEIGSRVNGVILIEITLSKDNTPNIRIKKKGKCKKEKRAKNSSKISEYIANRINITYIPAVRTEEHVISIVDKMINIELSQIEGDEKYKNAIQAINDLQKPILEEISQKIKNSLKEFIPDINEVETKIVEYRRIRSLRSDCEILIDDGNKTNIEFKGDGVKSLVALSLLKDGYKGKSFSLIAIEEPESHLHPGAIHSLRDSIYELGKSNQVIITTHNPLFVNSEDIKSNIIVNLGNAKKAKNISEIREILGVRVSDNLSSARFVLVVEGIEDKLALTYLFNYFSPDIKKALSNKLLVIDHLGGAGKLSYKLSLYKTGICKYHVLLDDDTAGNNSYNKASQDGLLEPLNTTLVKAKGKNESEFEDILNPTIYKNQISSKYGVNLDCDIFNNSNQKWSDRIKKIFDYNGKPYNEDIENDIKNIVAESIKGNEDIALFEHNKSIFESLKKSIENLISA